MRCAIPWINDPSPRLDRQQGMLARRLLADGHNLFIVAPHPRPMLNEVLLALRKAAGNDSHMGFFNSDCYPFINPSSLVYPGGVVGMSRVDSDGVARHGVDGYLIDCAVFDRIYAPDMPVIPVGGHSSDWYICRTAFKHGCYREIISLRHELHPRSSTSKGEDEVGKAGYASFVAYAKRNGIPHGVIPNLRRNSVE